MPWREAINNAAHQGGTKLDATLAGAAIGVGALAEKSWLEMFGTQAMIAGGLVLLAIRIGIAALRFYRDCRFGDGVKRGRRK